jgi:hypothetical protein
MPPRCLPDASQMLPRCLSDASSLNDFFSMILCSMIPPQGPLLYHRSSNESSSKFLLIDFSSMIFRMGSQRNSVWGPALGSVYLPISKCQRSVHTFIRVDHVPNCVQQQKQHQYIALCVWAPLAPFGCSWAPLGLLVSFGITSMSPCLPLGGICCLRDVCCCGPVVPTAVM